jgi:hypothetical protein
VLADLFTRIDNFFRRLEVYKEVQPTPAMTDLIVKIIVEVLFILSITTKEIKRGRRSERVPRNLSFMAHFLQENT